MPLAEGSILAGRYALDRIVGRGGQGTLWAATDRRSGQCIAIKVFGNGGVGAEVWSRRESKVLKTLPRHPHVVVVRDFGEEAGNVYLVMDWIEGRPLHELRRPRLERIQRWSQQLCQGLEHCHRHQVYHRDIKPSNVMITTADDAILVDFGIARTVDSTTTLPGHPVGSAAYMSPERWRGDRGDHLSDLYSFGCLLYELLTGDPPFGRMWDEADIERLRFNHLNDPPQSPKAGFSGIPDSIDRLTLDLLAKRPEDRPRSARHVIDRLQEIMHPLAGTTPMDTPAPPHVDPSSVDRLRAAEAALQRALREHGPDHLLTLEAWVEVADQTGRSGDRAGAIRAYDELIPHYDRVFGPYDQRSQQVRKDRMSWLLGKLP
jgi:serine/threonine protein kinase